MNTHMIAHVVSISSNFPYLTQFGQTGGLGPLFQSGIQLVKMMIWNSNLSAQLLWLVMEI